jgi:hypothetical protein
MNKKQTVPSTPKAVQDCRDLLLWMIPHLDKLPKNRRYTLGEKLENRILTVLESLVSAAYASNKRPFLYQANRDLEVCRHLWQLCFEFRAVSIGSYEHGSKLMFTLGKQIGGWLKVGHEAA